MTKEFISEGSYILHSVDFFKNLPSVMDYFPQSLNLKEEMVSWYGKTFPLPRLTAYYGDKKYDYSGVKNHPEPLTDDLLEIARQIEREFFDGAKLFNAVLCNYYRDGKDSVGWHSDDEDSLGLERNNIIIASVSFGSPRKFSMRNKQTKEKRDFILDQGDVFIMGGRTQLDWEHQIAKTSAKIGPRLNLTYRIIL